MSFRRSRAMTLAVVIWSGLALALVLYNTIRTFSASCGSSDEELFGDLFSGNAVCVNIAAHGGKAELVFSLAIQVGIIWAVGIGILAAIWFIVRDRGPASASVTVASVPAFPAAAPVAAPSAPPEGWYADAERPGHTRWWTGTTWGIRDDEHSSLPSATPRAEGDGASSAPAAGGAPIVAQADSAAVAPEPSTQPEGWYPDSERPGHTRWWNGTAWGMRDDEHSPLASPSPSASTDGDGAGGAPAPDDVELVAAAVATSVESPEAAPAAASSPEPASTSAQGSPVRFCENCGAPRTPTGKFCTACGHA